MRKRFVAYCQVPKRDSTVKGISVEAQRLAIKGYVEKIGGFLTGEHLETHQGVNRGYPALGRAVEECTREGSELIFARLSPEKPPLLVIAALRDVRMEFVALGDKPRRELAVSVLGDITAFERSVHSNRTRRGVREHVKRGGRVGNPRISAAREAARIAVKIKADEFAIEMLPNLQAAWREGVKSYAAIARRLNDLGVPTQRRCSWTGAGVRNVVERLQDLGLI